MTEPRSTIDIAKEIVREIRRANPTLDESETNVYHTIMGLRTLPLLAPFKGWRGENKKYATELIKWIEEGQTLLANSPEALSPDFFFADVPALGENRASHFIEILNAMRAACDWVVSTRQGVHGSYGYQQQRAAMVARGLMEKHGLPLAYSSPTSAYRTTARLFLEGMLGQTPDCEDIERACETVANFPGDENGLEILARF
jgi:hypothetical protein